MRPSVLLLVLFVSYAVCQSVTRDLVSIESGQVNGVCYEGHCSYKGIPYAESTAGEKRWTAPVKVLQLPTSPFDASEYSDICPQKAPYSQPIEQWRNTSEDCLSINVWRPNPLPSSALLPVMVWIHGGGFMLGASADPAWCGSFLANTSNIVVVSFNYRLGALGWLNTPQLSGNYGILDQQLALQWVQSNIKSFGGDPARVTVVGQSAGAMSINVHLVSPTSKGLFQQAILESNLPGLQYRTPQDNLVYAERFAGNVNCSVNDTACLRQVPLDTVIFYDVARQYVFPIPFTTKNVLAWMPVIDGTILPDQPLKLVNEGNFHAMPMIVGFVRNETSRFVPDVPFGNTIYEALVKAVFTSDADEVFGMYPPSRRKSRDQLDNLSTDYAFLCSGRQMAWSLAEASPVYKYEFVHAPEYDVINAGNSGCETVPCHSAEIPYVFHSQTCVEGGWWTEEEESLSSSMEAYWAAFIKNGTPGNDWTRFSISNNASIVFATDQVNMQSNYRREYCDFWDTMGYIY